MPSALAATLLRARQSTSFYTVPHYKYTGTHTTYMHWSTSGSVPRKWWLSSGTPPLSRGPYAHTQLGRGEPGRVCPWVPWGARCLVGAALHGGALGLPYYYYYYLHSFLLVSPKRMELHSELLCQI